MSYFEIYKKEFFYYKIVNFLMKFIFELIISFGKKVRLNSNELELILNGQEVVSKEFKAVLNWMALGTTRKI